MFLSYLFAFYRIFSDSPVAMLMANKSAIQTGSRSCLFPVNICHLLSLAVLLSPCRHVAAGLLVSHRRPGEPAIPVRRGDDVTEDGGSQVGSGSESVLAADGWIRGNQDKGIVAQRPGHHPGTGGCSDAHARLHRFLAVDPVGGVNILEPRAPLRVRAPLQTQGSAADPGSAAGPDWLRCGATQMQPSALQAETAQTGSEVISKWFISN